MRKGEKTVATFKKDENEARRPAMGRLRSMLRPAGEVIGLHIAIAAVALYFGFGASRDVTVDRA